VKVDPRPGSVSTRDVPAHHLAEPPADGEAKPCAAVFARRGRGRLGKLLEQLAHLIGRHADAGVGHRQRDPVAAVLLALASAQSWHNRLLAKIRSHREKNNQTGQSRSENTPTTTRVSGDTRSTSLPATV
jgi:hypothetical protein